MTPVLNKSMTVQLIIQKKVSGIVFGNDAKGCYDRLISGIALACICRIGYSKNSVRLLGSLWAQLEHHFCTGLGVSDKSYSSTLEKLIYGIGQGSCSSPIMWELLNQRLLAALRKEFDCIQLVSIYGTSDTTRPADSFADDTTIGATADRYNAKPTDKDIKDITDKEELVSRMEDIIQFFLDLLHVIGGDLAPYKCVWYLISNR
jgi:hypothetical protein